MLSCHMSRMRFHDALLREVPSNSWKDGWQACQQNSAFAEQGSCRDSHSRMSVHRSSVLFATRATHVHILAYIIVLVQPLPHA